MTTFLLHQKILTCNYRKPCTCINQNSFTCIKFLKFASHPTKTPFLFNLSIFKRRLHWARWGGLSDKVAGFRRNWRSFTPSLPETLIQPWEIRFEFPPPPQNEKNTTWGLISKIFQEAIKSWNPKFWNFNRTIIVFCPLLVSVHSMQDLFSPPECWPTRASWLTCFVSWPTRASPPPPPPPPGQPEHLLQKKNFAAVASLSNFLIFNNNGQKIRKNANPNSHSNNIYVSNQIQIPGLNINPKNGSTVKKMRKPDKLWVKMGPKLVYFILFSRCIRED